MEDVRKDVISRLTKLSMFQNDMFESTLLVINKYNPTYSELFFCLTNLLRIWADMMIEDENGGVMVRPVQKRLDEDERIVLKNKCSVCGGELMKRRSTIACKDCGKQI